MPNFLSVAYALDIVGHRAVGIRLDSGDIAYLSKTARQMFIEVGTKLNLDYFKSFNIVASNDINVETLESLNQQGHSVDTFGIGTHLVTCQSQPALGCVYKLVQINEEPRIKLSQDISKVTLPGRKDLYRLWGSDIKQKGPVLDIMVLHGEAPPSLDAKLLCRHPFSEHKRVFVKPSKVVKMLQHYWNKGKVNQPLPSLIEVRSLLYFYSRMFTHLESRFNASIIYRRSANLLPVSWQTRARIICAC